MSNRGYVKSYKRRPRASYKKASKRNPKLAAARYVANVRSSGFIGMEYKFYDRTKAIAQIANDGSCAGGEYDPATVLCLNAPIAGSGAQERDGWKISMKSIYVTGFVTPFTNEVPLSSATDLDDNVVVFIALVLDTQTNGAQLSSEHVYKSEGGTTHLNACPLRNLEHSKRFRVLDKAVITLPVIAAGSNTTALSLPGSAPFKLSSRSLPDVQFTSDAAGVSSISDNSLHVIAFTNAGNTHMGITYNSRLRFTG